MQNHIVRRPALDLADLWQANEALLAGRAKKAWSSRSDNGAAAAATPLIGLAAAQRPERKRLPE